MLKFLQDTEKRKKIQEYAEVGFAVLTIAGFVAKRVQENKQKKEEIA